MRIYPFFMLSLCFLPFQAEAMYIPEIEAFVGSSYLSRQKHSFEQNSQEIRTSSPNRSKRSISLPGPLTSQKAPLAPHPVINSPKEEAEDSLGALPQIKRNMKPVPKKRKSLPLPPPECYVKASLASFKAGDMPSTLNNFNHAEKLFRRGKIVPLYLPQKLDSDLVAFLVRSYLNFQDKPLCRYYFRKEEEYFLEQAKQANTKEKISDFLWEHIKYEHLADTGEHLQISPEEKKERIKTLRRHLFQK